MIAAFRCIATPSRHGRDPTPTRFDRQLGWLAGRLPTRPLGDLSDVAHSTIGVVLVGASLDWLDHALPSIERHKIPITAFIDVLGIERGQDRGPAMERPLDWSGVVEFSRSTFVTIGIELTRRDTVGNPLSVAHRVDHMTELLGERSGITATQVWYPDGPPPPRGIDRIVRERFHLATVSGGGANNWATDPFRMRRTRISPTDGPRVLDRRAAGHRGIHDVFLHWGALPSSS